MHKKSDITVKLLPIGSVIKFDNRCVCIIGYGSENKEQSSICGYFVTAYPVGFTSIEKVFFVPHYKEFDVVFEGYKTTPSEKMLDTLANSYKNIQFASDEDVLKLKNVLRKLTLKQEASEQ